jgi:hypothetical protein
MKKLILVLALVFGAAEQASATLINYQYTASVSNLSGEPGGIAGISTGDAVTGVISWDDAALPSSPGGGFYANAAFVSINVGLFSESRTTNIIIENGLTNDELFIESASIRPGDQFGVFASDFPSGTVFNSNNLFSKLDLNDFSTFRVRANFFGPNFRSGDPGDYSLTADLNSLTLVTTTVPEPSSLALLSLGIYGLMFARRKRNL